MEGVLIQIVMAALPSLIVSIVMARWNSVQKREADSKKAQEQRRASVDMRKLDLDVATAELSFEIAMAVKRGTTNGEMDEALSRQKTALEKFREAERAQVVYQGLS